MDCYILVTIQLAHWRIMDSKFNRLPTDCYWMDTRRKQKICAEMFMNFGEPYARSLLKHELGKTLKAVLEPGILNGERVIYAEWGGKNPKGKPFRVPSSGKIEAGCELQEINGEYRSLLFSSEPFHINKELEKL